MIAADGTQGRPGFVVGNAGRPQVNVLSAEERRASGEKPAEQHPPTPVLAEPRRKARVVLQRTNRSQSRNSRRGTPHDAFGHRLHRRLVDGIAKERGILREVRAHADLVIDTSALNVHELRGKIVSFFGGEARPGLRLNIVSFGFKYGLPVDADLVVDCRFLPNPHWVPELRPMNGLQAPVRDYVLGQPGAKEFLDAYEEVLRVVANGYVREGKSYATLAVGCTGGKHRSVAVAEQLAARLRDRGMEVQVSHRDVGRE